MREKILTLSVFSVFIVAMLAVFVSADISFDSVSGDAQTVVQGGTATVSFELEENDTAAVSDINFKTPITLTSGSNTIVSDDIVTKAIAVLAKGNTSAEDMSLDFTIPLTQARGTYTGTLAPIATYAGGDFNPLTITLTIENPPEVQACKLTGNPGGDLRVKDIDFNNLGILIFQEASGNIYLEFGDDDEWFPLDELEIEIEIENNGNDDIDDIEVEWGLYNTKSNEWVIELDEEDEVNINDDDKEIIDAEFNLEDELDVDLDKLNNGKNYRFYVIATGEVDDGASPTTQTCAFDSKNVEVVLENDFVVLTDVQFPETVQCGENVQISAKVWNIGEDDQDEVKVEVHNNDLGLFHKTTEIGDIDGFDDDVYTFSFRVPNDAEEKTHSLRFEVLDEDFDVYENDFDDDESAFTLPFRVSGGCTGVSAEGVSVFASLESGGKAGGELVVKAIITNNDDELKTFTVNAEGFSGWASSFTADRTSLVLGAGDSTDVRFTFNVNKDASGSQSFTIKLVSEDNVVTTQPVSVSIEKRSGLFGGLT
ncbi:hypothetical protein LCGC14_1955880, partial [marine sediment metagenome]